MITTRELTHQSQHIEELSQILSRIIEDKRLCESSVTCNLFFDFIEKVNQHFELEDKQLYKALLIHKEQHVNNTADRFMSASIEMKRIFKNYLKRWCNKNSLRITDHNRFVKETNEMFEMVLVRLQDETEHLYPTYRKVRRELAAAA